MKTYLVQTLAALSLAIWLAACGSDEAGTAPVDPPAPPPTAPAAAPTVNAIGASDRAITLGWSATAGATGWRIERRIGAAAYAALAELPATTRRYFDEGLQADTAYDYRITALGVAAEAGAASTRTGSAGDAPLTSTAASVGETLAEAQIGSAGGRVQTADGRIAVDLPANSFTTATTVRLRRLANTLAPALETTGADGVAIEFDTPPLQAPVLTLAWSASDDGDAEMLRAALQRADGSWLALPPTGRDAAQRRFSTALPTAGGTATALGARQAGAITTTYRIVEVRETVLKPQQAATPVSTTLEFKPWSIVLAQETMCLDELGCVPMPIIKPRALAILNQKPGYDRTWAVQGTVGGNDVHGRITPNATHGAVFMAPITKPNSNPVVVSFTTRHQASGRSTTLTTTVRITEPEWTGATRGLLSNPHGTLAFWLGVSSSTWRLKSATPTEERYEAEGVQRIEVENRGCSGVASPTQAQMPTAVLVINRSSSPATYTLDIGSEWNTAITGTCPDGTGTVPMRVPGRLQASGTLSGDGKRIEGERVTGDLRWEWFLTLGD